MSLILAELKARGMAVADVTNEESTKAINQGQGIYLGIDPTASSLHLGNYAAINMLKHFQQAGMSAFLILGGATGMIMTLVENQASVIY